MARVALRPCTFWRRNRIRCRNRRKAETECCSDRGLTGDLNGPVIQLHKLAAKLQAKPEAPLIGGARGGEIFVRRTEETVDVLAGHSDPRVAYFDRPEPVLQT